MLLYLTLMYEQPSLHAVRISTRHAGDVQCRFPNRVAETPQIAMRLAMAKVSSSFCLPERTNMTRLTGRFRFVATALLKDTVLNYVVRRGMLY